MIEFLNKNSNMPVSVKNSLGRGGSFYSPTLGSVEREVDRISREENVYLSVKQVPSCLMIRQPGSHSVLRNVRELNSLGFPMDISQHLKALYASDDEDPDAHISASQISNLNSLISSNIKFNAEMINTGPYRVSEGPLHRVDEEEEEESSEESEPDSERYTEPRERSGRILYADPFRTNAAILLAKARGERGPNVFVWGGDVLRLSDKIPKRLLPIKEMRNLHSKGGLPFYEITNPRAKMYVIRNKTFWGNLLNRLRRDKGAEEHRWARNLYKRIKHFLQGRHDPNWRSAEIVKAYGRRDYQLRSGRSRGLRLMQMLLTVDGIFQQRYLAFPEEEWDWAKFDRFVLGNISMLIGDEFIDGEISEDLLGHKTTYSLLKEKRQDFKMLTGTNQLTREKVVEHLEGAHPLNIMFRTSWMRYIDMPESPVKLQVRGILSQTRCAGTPPPLVTLQSKIKCLRTMVQPAGPFEMELGMISGTMRNIVSTLPDYPFMGLQTKAGLRATTAACYEKTRSEGGTIEAISNIVKDGALGRPCYVVDLNDGSLVGELLLNPDNPAEYIFWRCLEEVLAMEPEELRKVFLVVANEPGKARSVTKGTACLKTVLDVVNAICSWPMHKAFASSHSGMSKEAHGWNFFSSMFGENSNLAFSERTVTEERSGEEAFYKSTVYHDVFALSTDYETATDFLRHDVSEIIGRIWMTKCGIPKLLQGIVVSTCYRPRRIEFTAKGAMSSIGERVDDEVNYVISSRGLLMGDPLTKIVLHFTNICVRELASKITDYQWLSRFCENASDVITAFPVPEKLPEKEKLVI